MAASARRTQDVHDGPRDDHAEAVQNGPFAASNVTVTLLRDSLCWEFLEHRPCSSCNRLHLVCQGTVICPRHLTCCLSLWGRRRRRPCTGSCGRSHPCMDELLEVLRRSATAKELRLHALPGVDTVVPHDHEASSDYYLAPIATPVEDVERYILTTKPRSLRIVIDLAYDASMSEAEVKSLSTQVALCHALASDPRHRSFVQLTLRSCTQSAVACSAVYLTSAYALSRAGASTWKGLRVISDFDELRDAGRQIYLSPDASKPLLELSADDIYIIGGLVDRSPIRGASKLRASSLGLESRYLPLKEHLQASELLSLHAMKSLNVNSVMHILVEFARSADWGLAIRTALAPTQRGFVASGKGQASA